MNDESPWPDQHRFLFGTNPFDSKVAGNWGNNDFWQYVCEHRDRRAPTRTEQDRDLIAGLVPSG